MWLWKTNGRNAIARGQKPGKYRALTLGLWFGLEILGSMAGVILMSMISPDKNPLVGAYLLGVPGAAIGGLLSYQITKHAPQGNYIPDSMYMNQWNGQAWGEQQWENQQQNEAVQQMGYLAVPATIRIIEEPGGYTGAHDSFFLNGYPVCSLAPGNEYTFTTQYVKNVLTIGRPTQMQGNREYEVRFVAAENGFIEIHAEAGKLIPDKFTNYTAS